MNPSSGSKYLTPCRTFGLQRTHKRTSTPKGLTPQGRTSELSCLSTPFRSPLISKGVVPASPARTDPSNSVRTPSWTTPLLPKSRVKMGLSKPSPKTPLVQSSPLIRSELSKSSSRSASGQKLTLNKISARSKTNSIPETSQPFHPESSGHSSWDGDDEISEETDGKVLPAVELSTCSKEIDDSSSSSTPIKKDSCGSDVEIIEDVKDPKKNSANPQKSDSQSQDSFHGWDLDDDDSVDCDTKRDLFKKCISNMNCDARFVHNAHCDKPELSVDLSTQKLGLSESSKGKFRSKRCLLSDSDDGETNDTEKNYGSSSPENERNGISQSGRVSFLTPSDEDPGPGKSDVRSSILVSQEPKVQQDCGIDLLNVLKSTDSSIGRRKPPPKRRILSDSDDEDAICRSNQLDDECVDSLSPAVDKCEPVKCSTESVHSDAGLSSDSSENDHAQDLDFTSAIPAQIESVSEAHSCRSRNHKMYGSSESEVENRGNVSPVIKKKKPIAGNRHEGGKRHSRISVLSDSDDDNFMVKKTIQKELESRAITRNPLTKPVVELRRLHKSVTNEDGITPEEQPSRFSLIGGESTDEVPVSRSSCKIKTYGTASQILKKSRLLSYIRPLPDKSGTMNGEKLTSYPDKPITLQSSGMTPDVDDVVRQYIDAVSDTGDFEHMKEEMQKWLIGGQQVISQIIEEVRHQRGRDMSVMEVLQEHNIDPNLVGYDPVVEDFISFDRFLVKNNLSG